MQYIVRYAPHSQVHCSYIVHVHCTLTALPYCSSSFVNRLCILHVHVHIHVHVGLILVVGKTLLQPEALAAGLASPVVQPLGTQQAQRV